MRESRRGTPRAARKLLSILHRYEEQHSLSTELEDEFRSLAEGRGIFRASIWYWVQVLYAAPVYLRCFFQGGISMLWNHLKGSLRHIRRHKTYSIINIAGLALGMACCLVVLLFVREELRYDRFHANAERILRVSQEIRRPAEVFHSLRIDSWIAPELVHNFGEIQDAVRIVRWSGIVSHEERRFDERIFFADPSFFSVFTFPLIEGDEKSALSHPNQVVISRKLAEKYFGGKDPIGGILTLDGQYEFTVVGILEEIPRYSHIKFDFLASFDHVRNIYGEERYEKGRAIAYSYVLLNRSESVDTVEEKLPGFLATQRGERYASQRTLLLRPMTAIHLHSHASVELEKNSRASYSYLLTAVALLLLIIACINSINLSTARASRRSLEVGVRKVVGADRRRLFQQFLGESMVFAILAAVLALALASFLLPVFNKIMERALTLDLSADPILWLGMIGITMVVGLVSGSYPALFMASFRPVEVLKGKHGAVGMKDLMMRRGLVVFQFTLAVIFIIGALAAARQVKYLLGKELGFNKDQVLILPPPVRLESGYSGFKSELLSHPAILDVTAATGVPGRYPGIPFNFVPEGSTEAESVPLDFNAVDGNYFDFFGMTMVEGRSFSESMADEQGKTFILNESAVRKLGWDAPLGRNLKEEREGNSGRVIGVVRDFHNVSLHERISPAVFQVEPQMFGQVSVRIAPEKIEEVLIFLERKWFEWAPYNIFYYSFMDEALEALYVDDKKAGLVFRFATIVSVFIACLGLFGLSVHMAEQRVKEIGIRKTLGASVTGIVGLLSRDFMILVLISNVIAWPIVYYVMRRWLENFVYHTSLPLWLFLLGGGMTLLVALVTVGFQSARAATSDPVISLRHE